MNFKNIIEKNKIISFDIFDTLLVRPFSSPSDLYTFMENDVRKIISNRHINFKTSRRNAEIYANKIAGSAKSRKIDHVYQAFQKINLLSDKETEKLQNLELSLELQLCYKRQIGYEIYKEAIKQKKRIIFVTDTSFSESFIRKLLMKNNYTDQDHNLYVSCEHDKAKFDGTLYEFVLEKEGEKAEDFLHIGDNYLSDIQKSKEFRINNLHLKKSIDFFFDHKPNAITWLHNSKLKQNKLNSLTQSVFFGIIANQLYDNPFSKKVDNSLFNNSPHELGTYGLGIMIFSFAKWIIETSIKSGVKDLYFLSREGNIFKKVYDQLSPFYKDPPTSHYLLCSRRSTCVASITTTKDILSLASMRYVECSIKDFLAKRFGVHDNIVEKEDLNYAGFSSTNDIIQHNVDSIKINKLLERLSPKIIKNSLLEKENYIKYLDKKGLDKNSNNVSVVDIGYNGSPQYSLSKILDNKEIKGMYLLTFPDAVLNNDDGLKMEGFLTDLEDFSSTIRSKICSTILELETCLCSSDGSLVKFDDNQNPEFNYSCNEQDRVTFVDEVYRGINHFTTMMLRVFGERAKSINFHKQLIDEAFYSGITQFDDRRLFINLDVEDKFKCYNTRAAVIAKGKPSTIKSAKQSKAKRFIRHPRKFLIEILSK